MEKKFVIKLVNIDTIYEGENLPVIMDINLKVEQGEFISIIGPNGAGKTTLLETINGLLDYASGSGKVFGKEIRKNKNFIRRNTGYIVQNFEIDPLSPFLCKDIVMTGRTGRLGTFRMIGKKDWDKIWYSLGLVGMIDFANRPIGKLSGGEFQKILLARALAQQPSLLLLDEPFSNLDVSSKSQIETLLNRLHENLGLTIVMISHDLSFVPSRCSRIVVMDKGKIVMDDSKDKILKSNRINKIFNHRCCR